MRFNLRTPARFTKGHRKRVLIAQIAAVAAVPVVLFAFPSPPTGLSGAPGEGTCASCHSGTGSGSVTLTLSGGSSYTAGTPQTVTVTVSQTGKTRWGFELSARTAGNAQAGSFTAGTNSQILTSGSIQYVAQSSSGTQAGTANSATWSFMWTPPAAGAGPVTFYAVGLACNNDSGTSGDTTFTTSTALAESGGGGGGSTLTVSPTSLTFNSSSGATPPAQTFQVTSSGAPVSFTTSVSTTSGGSWLSATPTGGTTPMGVGVSVNPAGLSAGTYMGAVSVASASAANSPQSVGITFNVTGTGGGGATLSVSPAALTFTSSNGQSVAPQNVQVTSGGSALSFTASVSTTSGGNWLSVSPASGTTPATAAVSVAASGLSSGTYTGSVLFTAPGASNSPQNVAVTLVVGPSQPPASVPPLTFSFQVVDSQPGGSQRALIAGQGSVNAGGRISGGGNFTIYSGSGDEGRQIVATGTWTATQATSFTPAGGGSGRTGGDNRFGPEDGRPGGSSGGILVTDIQFSPAGGSAMPGSMRIASTGSDAGVTLTLSDGTSYAPTGVGSVTIRTGRTSGGGTGEDAATRNDR